MRRGRERSLGGGGRKEPVSTFSTPDPVFFFMTSEQGGDGELVGAGGRT